MGHYWQFIKGFVHIAQPLNEHLTGEGGSRKSDWVSLSKDALKACDALKQACMSAFVLAFANNTKEFLLETNASKEGLGAVLSQKTGRLAISPGHLWQQSPYGSWEKLPFHQAQVPSATVGGYGTFQRVLAMSTLPSEDWQ